MIEQVIVGIYGEKGIENSDFSGSMTLVKSVVHSYIKSILNFDTSNGDFFIEDL